MSESQERLVGQPDDNSLVGPLVLALLLLLVLTALLILVLFWLLHVVH